MVKMGGGSWTRGGRGVLTWPLTNAARRRVSSTGMLPRVGCGLQLGKSLVYSLAAFV